MDVVVLSVAALVQHFRIHSVMLPLRVPVPRTLARVLDLIVILFFRMVMGAAAA